MSTFSGLFAPAGAKSITITTTQTWTKPADMTGIVLVECIGGGGSGAFNFFSSTAFNLTGGLPGEIAQLLLKASDIPSSLTATIGAGGSPVTASTANQGIVGLDGGETSFGSLVKAKGGRGGGASTGTYNFRYGRGVIQGFTSTGITQTPMGASSFGEIYMGISDPLPISDYNGPTAGGGINTGGPNATGVINSLGYGKGGASAINGNGSAGAAPGGGGGASRQTANNGYQSGAGARGEIRIWYW